jgi:hypothetical protein
VIRNASALAAASRLAYHWEEEARSRCAITAGSPDPGLNVGDVLRSYVDEYLAGRASQDAAQRAARIHLLPALGPILLVDLKAVDVERFDSVA